ncbi:MAG: hypothetical protein ACJZ4Q_02645, partial [Candidatus Thalassarchaeaceae archaeon]
DGDGVADATCGTFTGFGSWLTDSNGDQLYDFYPGDGVADVDDWDPTSPAESADNDGDGWGDNADYDDDDDGIADEDDDDMDGDGFDNADETTTCISGTSDPQDGSDTPADMDGDGTCDDMDLDIDGDGSNNTDQGDGVVDAFPEDACADTDTDGDGKPDSLVTGCTSSLTEDMNDDSAQGEAHPNYYVSSSGYVYWMCDNGNTVYTSWVNDGYPDCSDGSDENADTTGFGPGSSEDAWTDAKEIACGTDPLDDTDTPADLDGDDLCDEIEDDDNDGDGYSNSDEVGNCWEGNLATDGTNYNTSANDSTSVPADNDGDSICDFLDIDDDNDGSWDTNETTCGTDPLDDSESPIDTDSDGTCNGADTDDDGDGVLDADEAASFTSSTTTTNTDGTTSTSTTTTDCSLVYDCDGDGVSDYNETDGSALDLDDDGAADGIHCAASTDCDGDGVDDATDALPVDPDEQTDFDGDGVGDNADTDDDSDGYSDSDETTNCDVGTYASTGDPMNGSDTPDDMDGDGTCDALDNDVDGDNIPNPWDQCPLDSSGYIDTDGDGLCDGDSDPDDDGDGTVDADDAFPLDGSETTDTDGDGVGDNADADDDGDGTDDQGDECPLDSSGNTDLDGDGLCDESDADDDGDGVDDADEESGCEAVTDCDGDGVGDAADAFDNAGNFSTDTDGDGLADSFDSNAAAVTYTIDTQSYGDLTVSVFTDSVIADCTLDTTGPGGSSSDYPATDGTDPESTDSDSCTVTTSDGISIVVENSAYITYYGAYFGYNAPNIDVTVDNVSVGSLDATYSWYTTGGEVWSEAPESDGVVLDSDDDGDGYSDADEDNHCMGDGGNSTDSTASPADNEGDGICDYLDDDDDDDGYSDVHEGVCGTDPTVAGDVSDFDGDGVCDSEDADDDDDGIDDDADWMPYDSSEWSDTDNDGVGDNEDADTDGDGTADVDDSDPTDRCSSTDTDGDGMTDSYDDCSDIGFYSTLNSDGTDGFNDGDAVGITDDTMHFGGAADGDQWFQASDTDGVFRMYVDGETGVSAVSMWIGIASTEYEAEDYYASYWVSDDGNTITTTELGNSLNSWGDIDNCQCEGFWGQWVVEVPTEDGYLMLEMSTDDDAELIGVDNIAYHDSNWDVISMITFEDSVEEMGVYTTPSSPSLLVGTYTIDIADSWGDGGQSVTAMHDGSVVCDITTDTNGASDSCTFTITGFSDTDLDVDFTSDYYASEGSMDITFPDGTVSSYSPSASYATDSYSFAHTGTEILPMEGTYTIEISDVYADGGQDAMAWFDGAEVCSLTTDPGGIASDSCTFTATGYADSVLDVDFTSTDTWGSEGTMVITLPNGTALTYGNSADFATDSYSFAHQGTVVQPVAGEVVLSNGHGATVSLDADEYHTGTVDDDDDNDGWYDADDAFPLDDSEWDDMDGDGIGSNADNDDDGDGTNDGLDDFPRHAHADTDTDGDGMPNDIGWTDGYVHDDFEIGNLSGFDDLGGWSGNLAYWTASSTSPIDGMYSASSSISGHNSSKHMEITVDTTDGWYSFDYQVSTEERYDELIFSVDGTSLMHESGTDYHWEYICETAGTYSDLSWEAGSLNDGSIPGNWVNDGHADCGDTDGDGVSDDEQEAGSWYGIMSGTFEGWVDAGTHTFTWEYTKDDSVSFRANRVWVDNVEIPYQVMGEGECTDSSQDCNIEDLDDDNDGIEDLSDDCPTDSGEQIDSDGDGFCDNADADDDNDGTYDYNDDMPLDPNETTDSDGDGIGDNADTDDDNDGCLDEDDDLPYDDTDCNDMDGDGVGDLTDPDDDGDNVMDVDDPF